MLVAVRAGRGAAASASSAATRSCEALRRGQGPRRSVALRSALSHKGIAQQSGFRQTRGRRVPVANLSTPSTRVRRASGLLVRARSAVPRAARRGGPVRGGTTYNTYVAPPVYGGYGYGGMGMPFFMPIGFGFGGAPPPFLSLTAPQPAPGLPSPCGRQPPPCERNAERRFTSAFDWLSEQNIYLQASSTSSWA